MMKKILAKLYFKIIGKTATQSNGIKLRYLFQKDRRSQDLLVIFSAFPRTGMSATYNYVNTLKEVPGNKLFILDDFGFQKRGVYYLCEQGSFQIRDAVEELIMKIMQDVDAKQTTYIGSSKGGYAALYFGFRLNATNVISGAPQYFVGEYLRAEPTRMPTLTSMLGEISEAKVQQLNHMLKEVISSKKAPTIHLHYSNKEHTYTSHIAPLLAKLADEQIRVEQDIKQYGSHAEVRHYFPPYLVQKLAQIRGESL
ncbi:YqiA/YcfP family alpha/beta fold hydrolase [Listeria booriae]|uniref:YqiA/YcfP family alpha/beta fold hydrolase n=1 Tax=Listeria booriae TaxID=1552123 RepID=UPI001629F651|nr:YqiA/YcfP family alpha/beta fold hydrolase [Listeria booriae]MBC2066821.1 Two component regulator three Y domain-containing protein [Listeria booriae]